MTGRFNPMAAHESWREVLAEDLNMKIIIYLLGLAALMATAGCEHEHHDHDWGRGGAYEGEHHDFGHGDYWDYHDGRDFR